MKSALVIHDDLNAIGGSERLAVDLATVTKPDLLLIRKAFGPKVNLKIYDIKPLKIIDLLIFKNVHPQIDDNDYDLIINTHGDLLPYYYRSNDSYNGPDNIDSPLKITYCHYPMLPYMVQSREYIDFLNKFRTMVVSTQTPASTPAASF